MHISQWSCDWSPPQTSQRSVCKLPPVLSLNCQVSISCFMLCVCGVGEQVEGEEEREFWRKQQTKAAAEGGSWVPHTLAISQAKDGQVSVREGEERPGGGVSSGLQQVQW